MKLKITGVGELDGEYAVELARFRNKDHRTIKEISGLGVLQYQDALDEGDIGFIVAIAYLVLTKQGKTVNVDDLWEADDTALDWVLDEADDARPPALENSPEPSEQNGTSGGPSRSSSEDSPVTLTPTSSGVLPSDTGSDSARETFFTSLRAS